MFIFVGLGNPGSKYAKNRHNVGFMAVEAIADRHGFGPARSKFHGKIRDGFFDTPNGRRKGAILLPETYMNDSGRAVRAASDFYKVGADAITVFYDELDLAPGKIKVKTGGGAAGHNGIRSINAHIDGDYQKVRIGIGHPGAKEKVLSHVLGDFAKSDEGWLAPLLDDMAVTAPALLDGGPAFTSALALRRTDGLESANKESKRKEENQDNTGADEAPGNRAKKNDPNDPRRASPFFDGLRDLIKRQD